MLVCCSSPLSPVLSNAGGGGERVLWTAIAWLQRERPNALCVVYTGDQVSKEEIVDKVKVRFRIHQLID